MRMSANCTRALAKGPPDPQSGHAQTATCLNVGPNDCNFCHEPEQQAGATWVVRTAQLRQILARHDTQARCLHLHKPAEHCRDAQQPQQREARGCTRLQIALQVAWVLRMDNWD
jgi:hypothetical protein